VRRKGKAVHPISSRRKRRILGLRCLDAAKTSLSMAG
jgi:hypothetical protein